jgi:hypothetical protein
MHVRLYSYCYTSIALIYDSLHICWLGSLF